MKPAELKSYINNADIESLYALNKTIEKDINKLTEYYNKNAEEYNSLYGDYKTLVSLLICFEKIPFKNLEGVAKKAHFDIIYLEKNRISQLSGIDKDVRVYFERFINKNNTCLKLIFEQYGCKKTVLSSKYYDTIKDVSIEKNKLTEKESKALLEWFSENYHLFIEEAPKIEPVKTDLDGFIIDVENLDFLEKEDAIKNEISAKKELVNLINERIKSLNEKRYSVENLVKLISTCSMEKLDKEHYNIGDFDLYEIADDYYYFFSNDKRNFCHVIYDEDGDVLYSIKRDAATQTVSEESANINCLDLKLIEENLLHLKKNYYKQRIAEDVKQGRQKTLFLKL